MFEHGSSFCACMSLTSCNLIFFTFFNIQQAVFVIQLCDENTCLCELSQALLSWLLTRSSFHVRLTYQPAVTGIYLINYTLIKNLKNNLG